VGVGEGYTGAEEVDIRGQYIAPALIDGHMHLEAPCSCFAACRCALARNTCRCLRPREIANVMGLEGIRSCWWKARRSSRLLHGPCACPQPSLETSGASSGP
jgi:adenine deaminase